MPPAKTGRCPGSPNRVGAAPLWCCTGGAVRQGITAINDALEVLKTVTAALEQLRRLYLELRTAETQIALEYYGGGTLYSHTLSRIGPDLEIRLADLISLTTRS